MRAPSFAHLPTVRHRIHVEFDVLDPRTGAGTRSRIPVEVDVPEDRHGVTPPDGVYADAGRGRNRLVTYCRVGDTSFAPLYDAALGNCPDIVLHDPDPGRQLAQLKFAGQYALPRRFDDVFSSDRPNSASCRRPASIRRRHRKCSVASSSRCSARRPHFTRARRTVWPSSTPTG
jgi:hypothetical protein